MFLKLSPNSYCSMARCIFREVPKFSHLTDSPMSLLGQLLFTANHCMPRTSHKTFYFRGFNVISMLWVISLCLKVLLETKYSLIKSKCLLWIYQEDRTKYRFELFSKVYIFIYFSCTHENKLKCVHKVYLKTMKNSTKAFLTCHIHHPRFTVCIFSQETFNIL